MSDPTDSTISQDSKNLSLLIWIGTIFLGFIPAFIAYVMKKDDEFVTTHAKEALNWFITAVIGYVAGLILMVVLIGFLVMIAVGIAHVVICVLGALASSRGEPYQAPFALRLVK